MTVYAEERQQAIAAARRRARPALGGRARRAVRRHHRDRPPRPRRARAAGHGAPGARRRRPAGALTWSRPASRERDGTRTEAEGPDRRARRSTCCPPPTAAIILDGGSTTGRLAALLPPDRALTSPPTPCRSPPGWPATPGVDAARAAAAGSAASPRPPSGTTPSRRCADLRVDVVFLGTNGISAEHGFTTPDRAEAAAKRAMVARARQRVVVLADSSKLGREHLGAVRRARGRRRPRHRRRRSPTADVEALERRHRGRGRMTVAGRHDRHADRQPQPRPHRRPSPARSSAARSSAPAVTHQAGRQGRQHGPRRAPPPALPSSPCCPAARTTRSSPSCSRAGIDCRPVPPAGDVRINYTLTEPDGTTTKLNSPAPRSTAGALGELERACCTRTPRRRLGGAGRLAAARRARRAGTPSWSPSLRDTGARVAVDTSEAPLLALVARRPGAAPRPAEAERRGAGSARRRRRGRRWRPTRRPPPAAAARCTSGASARCCSTLGGARRPARRPPTARGTPHRRPITVAAPSAPATAASPATCSPTWPAHPGRAAAPAVAYGARPPRFQGRQSRSRGRRHPERV